MTKSLTHTPGPWYIDRYSANSGVLFVKPVPGQIVCEVDPLPEAEANARLIAAAPEMLVHLVLAVTRLTINNIDGSEQPYIDDIKQIINAATDTSE